MNAHVKSLSPTESSSLGHSADAACSQVVDIVAAQCHVSPVAIHAPSRCRAHIASARQLAMYLCHVLLGLTLTEVGRYFHRDRTTVAYACAAIEDLRDCPKRERDIVSIETLILDRVCPWQVRLEACTGRQDAL